MVHNAWTTRVVFTWYLLFFLYILFSAIRTPKSVGSTVRGVMSLFLTSGVCGLKFFHPLWSDASPSLPPLFQWFSDVVWSVRVWAAARSSLGASSGQVRLGLSIQRSGTWSKVAAFTWTKNKLLSRWSYATLKLQASELRQEFISHTVDLEANCSVC